MKEEMKPGAVSYDEMWLTYFKRPHNHRFEGKSIAETAALMGKDEVDAMCDLLLDEDLQVCYVMAGTNGMTLPKFINHPLSMIGSDGVLLGDYPSPRTYGTFPTVLQKFVREEGGMSLPDAVRKMTSFPAQRLGIPDRGLLRDGFKADLVVFDAGTVGISSHAKPSQAVPRWNQPRGGEWKGGSDGGTAHRCTGWQIPKARTVRNVDRKPRF